MTTAAMRMLVSVRDSREALDAADAGADFIDLKEPRAGALGALALTTIREVVGQLRMRKLHVPISATIGDVPMNELSKILGQVDAVGACGVDYVKVGIEREAGAASVLAALGRCGWPVVPVLIADRGLDEALVARACAVDAAGRPVFPAVMVDTADKRAGSLLDLLGPDELQQFVDRVHAAGAWAGVAGALRASQVDRLVALRPDFAGFRSAVCEGDRASRLDAKRVRDLSLRMKAAAVEFHGLRNTPLPAR